MKLTGIFLLAAALTISVRAGAGEPLISPSANGGLASRTEQMQALETAADKAEAAYVRETNEEASGRLWSAYRLLDLASVPQVYALAIQEPASAASFQAFQWIVTNRLIQIPPLETNGWKALEYLRDYHTTNPGIASLCRKLGRRWDPDCAPALELLQMAADKNPDREVRGQATLALGRLKKLEAEGVSYYEAAPPGDARFEKFRKEALATAGTSTAAEISAAADKLFKRVLADYADCPSLDPTNTWQVKTTLGEAAAAELFDLEHLSLGSIAPDIAGEDVDGNHLKLSDYRGKVVVLSFWASWCGPCMQMVPSEVRLVERMKGKPFALVGVNGDDRREDAKKAAVKNRMTWPSFFSTNGPSGPIPTAWNVSGWPTVFVLDPGGVIRFKFTGYGGTNSENLLHEKIDQLLVEK